MGSEYTQVKSMPEHAAATPWLQWALPLLWKSRQLVIRTIGAGILLSVALAFVLPKKYQSTVRLMPPDPRAQASNALLASAMIGTTAANVSGLNSLVNMRSPNAVFLAILESRTAQDDIINRLDLRKEYDKKLYVDTRRILASCTTIDEDRKSGVLTLKVTDSDPGRARDLATAYVDELNKLVAAMDTSTAHRERVFLEERLKVIKDDLDATTLQLSQFSSRNATMDVQNQSKVMLDATTKLQGELIAAQAELHGMQTIYTADNTRVRQAQARVNTLQSELRKLTGSQGADSGDLEAGQLYPSLKELPLLGVRYTDLYRRAAIQQTIYEILTKQYEVAKVEEAKEIPMVKVLDLPDYPERKSFPKRWLVVMIGTLLSIIGVVAWILVHELWREAGDTHPVKAAILQVLASLRTSPHNAGTEA
jgi:uncharacterized protein involved in exopolysaccharide biosynthesis